MIRIAIDAHGVGGYSRGLGNETYFKHLIGALLAIDPTNEYHVLANHPEKMASIVAGRSNVRLVSLWPRTQWLQRPFSLPAYVARHRIDVLHCPFIRPPIVTARTVVTVHDICFEEYPEHFRRHELWRLRTLVPYSCARSDMILTVSEFARDQILRHYAVPPEKVIVTYNSADHVGPTSTPLPPAPQVCGGQPYILYTGLIQPRKNLVRLVKAFEQVRDRGLPHHLVLVGPDGWSTGELFAAVEASPYRDSIHFLGYLTGEVFASAMANAGVFAFPSVFESFGIPPMEAQRWGIPALVSNGTCFPEIYGDSVGYCDPYSVSSIADALYELLTDADLRARLREKGFERSRRFSWRNTAAVVLNAYERVHDGRAAARTQP